MIIKTQIEQCCPSGFYCMKNGVKKCRRIRIDFSKPYCELFRPFLDRDSQGNVLKCEQCLLAERKERLSK